MIGIVFREQTTPTIIDKVMIYLAGTYSAELPTNIHNGTYPIGITTTTGKSFFKAPFYTTRSFDVFRFVNIIVVPDNIFDIHEVATGVPSERIAYVSNDNLNIVAYRAATYQVVTVASLDIAEVINIGELSFADMQLVMTAAATLTSPQVRYISAIGDDTVTFTEL